MKNFLYAAALMLLAFWAVSKYQTSLVFKDTAGEICGCLTITDQVPSLHACTKVNFRSGDYQVIATAQCQ